MVAPAYILQPGNADDLAEKVNWAWNHPEQMRSMGKEARQEFEAKYTAEKNYPLLMEIYQRAIWKANPNVRNNPNMRLTPPESNGPYGMFCVSCRNAEPEKRKCPSDS